MKLDRIEIHNFRCFPHYEFRFATQCTILIGKNGSGKTSLLNAVKRGVSFIFSKAKNIPNPYVASGSYLKLLGFDSDEAYFDPEKNDDQYPISITCEGSYNDSTLPTWTLFKKSVKGALYESMYKDAFQQFISEYQDSGNRPLYAYFSDSYPHIKSKDYSEDWMKIPQIPVSYGYYQWQADSSCATLWQQRFIYVNQQIRNIESEIRRKVDAFLGQYETLISDLDFIQMFKYESLSFKESFYNNFLERFIHYGVPATKRSSMLNYLLSVGKDIAAYNRELSFIVDALTRFSETIQSAEFGLVEMRVTTRRERDRIELLFANNNRILFDDLPMGYKRLFSIVMDIAYRSFILNGTNNSSGIVIVDEIDLHLHPSLETSVVEGFLKTFPSLQFIISTHSPLVISNFRQDKKNKIFQLENHGSDASVSSIPNMFGVDYSSTVRDAMNTPSDSLELEAIKDQLFVALERGNRENADRLYQLLIEKCGGENTVAMANLKEELSFWGYTL